MILDLAIPSPDISFIQLGPFRVHFYALFILTGIVVATLIAGKRLRRFGAPAGVALDLAPWAVVFGIIGGRVYHVLTHPEDYFFPGADLWRTLYAWEGGLAIFGAIMFGSLGAWIGARRMNVRFIDFADALAPGMLLAQAIGRTGNYFNQELFGTPTTLPWGLQIDPGNPAIPPGLPGDTLFHPLFLYEMLWNVLGFVVVLAVEQLVSRGQERRRQGWAVGMYFIWYGIGRAWFESFRLDPTELEIFGLKVNIITALIAVIVGVTIIVVNERRRRVGPRPEAGATPRAAGDEQSPDSTQ